MSLIDREKPLTPDEERAISRYLREQRDKFMKAIRRERVGNDDPFDDTARQEEEE